MVAKRHIFLVIYFSLLAVILANCAQNTQAGLNQDWNVNDQLQYTLPTNDPTITDPSFVNSSTFRIEELNATSGSLNASRDARPSEPFPFILLMDNLTDFRLSGDFIYGTGIFGEKSVSWMKVNVSDSSVLRTSYLSYLINPLNDYYYLLDNDTGVVLELVDATRGTVLLSLTKWPDQFTQWDLIFTIIASIISLFIFIAVFRFSTRELRIAPKTTTFDKVKVYFSSLMLAGLVTAVVMFIAAIVLTAIGENWKLALHFGVPQVTSGGTIYLSLGEEWHAEIGFIQAFEWPTYIPITAILIGIYIIIYPFFEMLFIAKKGSDAPTEIQQKLENNVIDRAPPPLNFVVAIGFLFIVYLLPTFLLFTWYKGAIPSLTSFLQMDLLLVAIAWFTIPAIFFLNYYASFGVTAAYWTSLRKGFKGPSKKENITNMLIFGIVMMLLFTTAYGFLSNLINIFAAIASGNPKDVLPAIVLQNPSDGMQFLTRIIRLFFLELNPFLTDKTAQLKSFDDFITVFPLDIIIFFLTVCIVGLYGFYSKFLSREPLNRPVLVLFASYIIAAIGINVFISVILRLPNAYTGGLLVDPFTNPNGYVYGSTEYMEAFWNHYTSVRILFFIPYFADKTIMFAMVVYNLFGNKELRLNINESVLNYAIQKDRLDILSKYTTSDKPETQMVVIENIHRIIKNNPVPPKQSIPALEKLIISPEPGVNKTANETLFLLSQMMDIQAVEKLYLKAIQSDSEIVRQNIEQCIILLGKKDPSKVVTLYSDIITSDLTIEGQEIIVRTLGELNNINPKILANAVIPMLDNKSPKIRIGALKILKRQIRLLQDKNPEIVPKLLKIITEKDDEESLDGILVLGTIGAFDTRYAKEIQARFDEISKGATQATKLRLINGTMNLMVAQPGQIDDFLPKILLYLEDPREEIRSEVAAAIRGAGVALAENEVFNQIEKILFKLLQDKSDMVRISCVQAIAVIGKANSDLLQADPEFIQMVEMIIKDPASEVRNTIAEMFVYYAKAAPTMVIYYLILKLLAQNLPLESNRVLFYILSSSIEGFPREENIDILLNPVLAVDRHDDEIRHEVTEFLGVIARTRLEILPRIYPIIQALSQDKNDRIAKDAIRAIGDITIQKLKNPQLPIEASVDDMITLLLTQCESRTGKPRAAAVIALTTIFDTKPELHEKIYPVFVKLLDDPQPDVLKRVILVLTNIICSNKEIYGPKKGIQPGDTVWVPATKFNQEFLPGLIKMMKIEDREVKEALSIAINIIADTFPESTPDLGMFLKRASSPREVEASRIMAISVLGKFLGILEDPALIKALIRAIHDKQSSEVRIKALNSIESIIEKTPEIKELDRIHKKRLTKLIYPLFRTHFLSDSDTRVRKAYAETLVTIKKKQPEIDQVYSFLRQMVLDPDPQNSAIALKGFFNLLHDSPEKIGTYAHYFRGFGRSIHLSTRKILSEQIGEILNLTGKIEYILPTILLLTRDQDSAVRQPAFEEFKKLIAKYPLKVDYFRQVLMKLAIDKKAEVRGESVAHVVAFLVKYPEFIVSGDPLFQEFLDLSRDATEFVRMQVVKSLPEIIPFIKAEQLNGIFQALFRFVREESRRIKEAAIEGFHIAIQKFPGRVGDVVDDLKRINKREQLVLLQQLIDEFTAMLLKHKGKRNDI